MLHHKEVYTGIHVDLRCAVMLAVSSLDGAQLLLRAEELRDSGSGRPVCEVTLCHRKGRKVGVVCVAMATMLILDSAVGAVMAVSCCICH